MLLWNERTKLAKRHLGSNKCFHYSEDVKMLFRCLMFTTLKTSNKNWFKTHFLSYVSLLWSTWYEIRLNSVVWSILMLWSTTQKNYSKGSNRCTWKRSAIATLSLRTYYSNTQTMWHELATTSKTFRWKLLMLALPKFSLRGKRRTLPTLFRGTIGPPK